MTKFKYISFGITNECEDAYQIPFFDYDVKDLLYVIRELQTIQTTFQLSNIYIIKSLNGYNAFSFDKLTINVLKTIYIVSRWIDKDFIKYGLQRGFMTLRMGYDKQLIYTLHSSLGIYQKSLPHKKFFTQIMEFQINDNENFDDKNKLILSMFPSNKHGFKMKKQLENLGV